MSIPADIAARAAELHRERPMRVFDWTIKPGDVRVVRAGDTVGHVCLVVKTSTNATAQVTLVHPYTEMATESDIVVPRTALEFNPGYDMVVQTGLRAAVYMSQLSDWILARVPGDILQFYWKGADAAIPEELGVHRGTATIGHFDCRLEFKKEQISSIRELSHDCTADALEES